MIRLYADDQEVKVEWVTFSDGAVTCKIQDFPEFVNSQIIIRVEPETPVIQVPQLIKLLNNALMNYKDFKCALNTVFVLDIPYLPNGRADRIFESGNPNPLEEFLTDMDKLMYDELWLVDPHNEEIIDELGYDFNIKITSQLEAFKDAMELEGDPHFDFIVAPDAGAEEKAKTIGLAYDVPVLQGRKKRDVSTGQIIEIGLEEHPHDLKGKNVIIIDDICDGGGTFIPLAKELQAQGAIVKLYVTHLIASKGLELFKDSIQEMFFYHIVSNYVTEDDVHAFNLYQQVE